MGPLLLIILLMVRKDVKDIQMGMDYIYNKRQGELHIQGC